MEKKKRSSVATLLTLSVRRLYRMLLSAEKNAEVMDLGITSDMHRGLTLSNAAARE